MKLKRITFTTDLELPLPTIYWQFPKCYFPIYKLVWPFLWHRKVSGLKKDLPQRLAHQPHSQMYLSYVSTDGRLMGPLCSPQPDICTSFWCPLAECKGVACGWGSPPLKLEEQLERQTPVPHLQGQKLQVLWTPDGGRWETVAEGGMASLLRGRWGCGQGRVWYCCPQKSIETLCLWTSHCCFHLS